MVVNPWNYTAIIQFVTIHALIFMSPLCFQSNQTITYIPLQRYTASCGDRVNTHIGTRWMNFFGGKQAGSWFDTTNLTNLLWPPLSLHRHKKKCLVSTTFILLYYTTAPNNVK